MQMRESKGYEYFSNRKDAEKSARDNAKSWEYEPDFENDIEEKDFVIGKYKVLALLNHWGSHPDNG